MSTQHHHDPLQITPDPERLHLYHCQQLSAMLDGELPPDAARFMLRRLQHDASLAERWERWQVCGDVLRGRADDLLPADFARRVAQAIHCPETTTAPARAPIPRHRRHWHAAALAASLAALALWVVVREPLLPEAVNVANLADAADAAAAAVELAPAPVPLAVETPTKPAPSARSAQTAEPLPAVTRSARPARAIASANTLTAPALAQAAPATPPAGDLLAPALQAPLAPRPWPRSLLPGANTGTVRAVVGYGVAGNPPGAGSAPPTTPPDAFQPHWPEVAPSKQRTAPVPPAEGVAGQAARKRP